MSNFVSRMSQFFFKHKKDIYPAQTHQSFDSFDMVEETGVSWESLIEKFENGKSFADLLLFRSFCVAASEKDITPPDAAYWDECDDRECCTLIWIGSFIVNLENNRIYITRMVPLTEFSRTSMFRVGEKAARYIETYRDTLFLEPEWHINIEN